MRLAISPGMPACVRNQEKKDNTWWLSFVILPYSTLCCCNGADFSSWHSVFLCFWWDASTFVVFFRLLAEFEGRQSLKLDGF